MSDVLPFNFNAPEHDTTQAAVLGDPTLVMSPMGRQLYRLAAMTWMAGLPLERIHAILEREGADLGPPWTPDPSGKIIPFPIR